MATTPTSAQLVLALIYVGVLSIMLAAWAWAIARIGMGRGLLPPAPIKVVPWRAKHVLAVLLLYIGIQVVLPGVLLGLAGIRLDREPGLRVDPALQNLVMMAINIAFFVFAPSLLARWSGADRSDYGFERGRIGRDVVRGLVAWPLLAPIVFGINFLVIKVWEREHHPLEKWVAAGPSPLIWAMAGLSAVVLAPLAEEFLFRGVLLGWLGRWASGLHRLKPDLPVDPDFGHPVEPTSGDVPPKPAALAGRGWRFLAANVAVSVVFAAMHGPVWPSPVPLFFLSLGLGVLYQRTGGLVAPVTLHATFNGISTALLYLTLLAGGPDALKSGDPKKEPPVPPKAAERPRDVETGRHPRPSRIET